MGGKMFKKLFSHKKIACSHAHYFVLLDLLCMSPYYDHYLTKSLHEINNNTKLVSTSFHLDYQYYVAHKTPIYEGIVDIVSRLQIRNALIRRILKSIEYIINLLILIVKFSIHKPDILHIQWIPIITQCPLEKYFLKVIKYMKINTVYTVHNILPHDTGNRYESIYKEIYHMVDSLVCHTEQTRDILVKSFNIDKDKIHVIPHGPLFHDILEEGLSIKEARKQLKLDLSKTYVLFIGLIKPYKGIEFLLETWKEIYQGCPDAQLVIAGNGNEEYLIELKKLITKLDIQNAVNTSFKFLSNRELALYHRAVDILVYPYQNITQSGALLTGMSYGKAIVATDVGGFRETLINNESALLIPYGNCKEFANALIKLICFSSERVRIGNNASQQVLEKYMWADIAQLTINCYYKLLRMDKSNLNI